MRTIVAGDSNIIKSISRGTGLGNFLNQKYLLSNITVRDKEALNDIKTMVGRLAAMGVKTAYGRTKLYLGKLPQACRFCAMGRWACIFPVTSCTRRCFFCPTELNDRHRDRFAYVWKDRMKNEKGLIDHLSALKPATVSFSGGEPMLALKRVLRITGAIRKRFGKAVRVYLYTNGDLVNERNLKKLKEAGLDEMRFNLAANGYNIKPVKLAVRYFEDVYVEMPAIPEDEPRVRRLLLKLNRIAVKGVNLHELNVHAENAGRLKARGYEFLLGRQASAVLGSFEMILGLFEFAAGKNLGLNLTSCTNEYKEKVMVPMTRSFLSENAL